MNEGEEVKIYYGSRGGDFLSLISNLLKKGKLKSKYIDLLLGKDSMKEYDKVFTAYTADPINNYERYEQLGDLSINKFIVGYSYKRFPQLMCTDGVKVAARLRINYGSKEFLSKLADNLGFWPFISAGEEDIIKKKNIKYTKNYYRKHNKKDLLEDSIEAFIGCTEYLLDQKFTTGVGYAIVYAILENIYNDIDISLNYYDLFDAKTILKETFDLFPQLGSVYYHNILDIHETPEETYKIIKSTIYQIPDTLPKPKKIGTITIDPRWKVVGRGKGNVKSIAEQNASKDALERLKKMGYVKKQPEVYSYFCR